MTLRVLLLLASLAAVLAVARMAPPPVAPVPLLANYTAPAPPPQDNQPDGSVDLRAAGVHLSWTATGEETVLYRSTCPLEQTRLNDVRFPIVTIRPTGLEYRDTEAPNGVTLHYQLRVRDSRGNFRYSKVLAVDRPQKPLPTLRKPSLFVDKTRYLLEVRDDGRTVKRYPVALGRNPARRKLHQDNASTPEGRYRIVVLQPTATFYRAYDLDYPTAVDQERYDLAAELGLLPSPTPGIGGEIQIHGRGIDANWTYGCIALRNEDMDELFAHPEIAVGVPVEIVGREVTAADLDAPAADLGGVQDSLRRAGYDPGPSDGQLGGATKRALGRFQAASGLPLTMWPDQRTREKLGL